MTQQTPLSFPPRKRFQVGDVLRFRHPNTAFCNRVIKAVCEDGYRWSFGGHSSDQKEYYTQTTDDPFLERWELMQPGPKSKLPSESGFYWAWIGGWEPVWFDKQLDAAYRCFGENDPAPSQIEYWGPQLHKPENPPPTVPGFYWATNKNSKERLLVGLWKQADDWWVSLCGDEARFPATDFTDWKGPIVELS